ncbi:4'-phosphopantetheinyl transferase superfamily protein [Chryseobacterium panacisoli]|uniref:4'-phosphopantetheinyl transferase superfamily protein n=1 Tax=Chryseobacterium panacisoli TaxID=1807141 RepID=A0A5D8ZDS3_9FLAO|nr:4'-phosphopantetheinyl transferase superfamily protein [Chryseobacterium panacisoli]TZF92720.1 4'-phosphopantetheinyl transferase superfamily protein [Chryseobacterium panacisoli]
MIILYTFINEEKHKSVLDRYLPVFSDDTKRDILRYRRWQDAQLSLLGKILLREGLRTHYDISDAEIRVSPNNKPYLKGNPVHFNISHSKDLVACVIAEFPVGIDVEFFDTSINYLDFEFQMTTEEFEKINGAEDRISSFFTYWTAKEAVIKAHGDGMMIPLDSFEVSNKEGVVNGEKFFIKDIFIDKNYCSCIASKDININNVVPLITYVEIS